MHLTTIFDLINILRSQHIEDTARTDLGQAKVPNENTFNEEKLWKNSDFVIKVTYYQEKSVTLSRCLSGGFE